MPTIFIKPETNKATGKPYKVRMPNKPHEFLPEKGAKVEKTKYWVRRLRDGSVFDPVAKAEAVKKAKEEAKKAKASKTTTKE